MAACFWQQESRIVSNEAGRRAAVTGTRGFTLIELLIVVGIIAILAAIAYPSYTSSVAKTKRKAAAACLSQYANYMERFYTTNLNYKQDQAGTANALPSMDCAAASQTGNDYDYGLPASSLSTSAYVIQAVPKGAQATRDAKCGTLTLDQKGTRGVTGANTVAQCW